MKMIALLTIMLVHAASGQHSWDKWQATLIGSTNVDGSVLRLEFATNQVIAGERIQGRMVISNAATAFRQLRYEMTKRRDSYIGDLLVVDQDGNRLPKTVWSSLQAEAAWSKGRSASLWPSNSSEFSFDLVARYSLTNPGIYLVKAVAQVPMPVDVPEDVVVETPPVAITVLPRPEGAPPPEPLHTAAELARVPPNEEPPMMQVTPPRSRTNPPSSSLQPQPGIGPSGVSNPKLRAAVPVAGGGPNDPVGNSPAPATRSRMRTVAYACIVLLGLAVLGAILWRSRRSHP